MGNKYTCKVWTETCPVTPETRGRCQRCRYLACTRAGMVADLVMADKERLSRLRLVDQNRERRRQEAGAGQGAGQGGTSPASRDTEQDTRLVELLATLHAQLLAPVAAVDLATVSRAAHTWVEWLLFQLCGHRPDLGQVAAAAAGEVAAIQLAATSRLSQLELLVAGGPLLAELGAGAAQLQLSPTEQLLGMALVATRPRLSWPGSCRQELSLLWEVVAGTVRRVVPGARMPLLLQLVHQSQAVTFYLGQAPLHPTTTYHTYPSYPGYPPTSSPSRLPSLTPASHGSFGSSLLPTDLTEA